MALTLLGALGAFQNFRIVYLRARVAHHERILITLYVNGKVTDI
jgi:hypothetical protein